MSVRTLLFASDIHIPDHDPAALDAFLQYLDWLKPWGVVWGGDFYDFTMFSRFAAGVGDETDAQPSIRNGVEIINFAQKRCTESYFMTGNHDIRLEAMLMKEVSTKLGAYKDLLSLRNIMLEEGLDPLVHWVHQDKDCDGVWFGEFLVNHGHVDFPSGGPEHAGFDLLKRRPGWVGSRLCGHTHRPSLHAFASNELPKFGISSGYFQKAVNFAADAKEARWVHAFTELQQDMPRQWCNPYLVIIGDGRFCARGKVFDGNRLKFLGRDGRLKKRFR